VNARFTKLALDAEGKVKKPPKASEVGPYEPTKADKEVNLVESDSVYCQRYLWAINDNTKNALKSVKGVTMNMAKLRDAGYYLDETAIFVFIAGHYAGWADDACKEAMINAGKAAGDQVKVEADQAKMKAKDKDPFPIEYDGLNGRPKLLKAMGNGLKETMKLTLMSNAKAAMAAGVMAGAAGAAAAATALPVSLAATFMAKTIATVASITALVAVHTAALNPPGVAKATYYLTHATIGMSKAIAVFSMCVTHAAIGGVQAGLAAGMAGGAAAVGTPVCPKMVEMSADFAIIAANEIALCYLAMETVKNIDQATFPGIQKSA